MTAQLAPATVYQAFTPSGSPLSGGKLFTYAAGTSTPQATYVDSTQTTQNTNPVTLNASGQANVWLDPTLKYKFVLQDSLGNLNPPGTVDNINGSLSGAAVSVQSLVVGVPPSGTQAVVINGNSTDSPFIINSTLAAGTAMQLIQNVDQGAAFQIINTNLGANASGAVTMTDTTDSAFIEFQGINVITDVIGGVNGRVVNVGGTGTIPLQLITNHTVRATFDGTTGNLTLKANLIGVNGSFSGPVGVNGASPPAQVTGWGTPVGGAVVNNYNITDAGGASSNTNKAVAEIIAYLKSRGDFGA